MVSLFEGPKYLANFYDVKFTKYTCISYVRMYSVYWEIFNVHKIISLFVQISLQPQNLATQQTLCSFFVNNNPGHP